MRVAYHTPRCVSPPPDAICRCTILPKSKGQALLREKLAALGITTVSSDLTVVCSASLQPTITVPPNCLCGSRYISPTCLHHAFHPDCASLRLHRPLHRAEGVCVCRVCFGARLGVGVCWV